MMTLWFSLEWGRTHVSYHVMFIIFKSLPTGGADVIYIILDHIYHIYYHEYIICIINILSRIYHIYHLKYLCILPSGGADVCWEVWPANWKMGDGEGDAQKKATLDTLLHKITNDFQCQCLCHCICVCQVSFWLSQW